MALTPDYTNRIIHSDASITDAVVFHDQLRDIEASETGVLYPVVHTYKELSLGGGAIFPAVDFINGWTLQFAAGNWTVSGGNISGTINPVANCYVERMMSSAYTFALIPSGSGLSTEEHDKLLAVPTADSNATTTVAALTSSSGFLAAVASDVWNYER
jgi:hypothetical protein